jgi:hypothetical protein
MTSESRFERGLPAILEDLYLGPSPDYRDEVMAVATAVRQRPAWTFPGRWIPMADIAGRSAIVPRVPWRSIGVALLIAALLIAAAVAYIGSRPVRVPPPFGVARNGLIAYASNGEVYTADPESGAAQAVVSGPELDRSPRFSRDGLHIAFLRQNGGDTSQFQLAVVGRDGGKVTVVTTAPIGMPDLVEWSPDNTSIFVNSADARLTRYDAAGNAAPVIIADGVHVQAGMFRPPDGAQILYQPDGITGTALWVMNADGTDKHELLKRGSEETGGAISGSVAWSPDGRLIAFGLNGDHDSFSRIHVMNADGTGLRRLDKEPGVWVDNDLVWSPNGTRIAFNRWLQDSTDASWDIQPIGIVSVDGGPVIVTGPTPVSDGASFDWSPDGASIVSVPGTILAPNSTMTSAKPTMIDAISGLARELDVTIGSATSWQRLAP